MNLDFISEDFLLESEAARRLFHEYAENAPIVDFHNHLNVEDIRTDKRHANIGEFWVCSDGYKYRAMRISGFDERLMTGDAPVREKFDAWCRLLPYLVGNPLFHWSCMEMKKVFGLDEVPSAANSSMVWEKCNERLAEEGFTTNAILNKFNVKCLTTSDDLLFDVSKHSEASRVAGFSVTPSLRADSALAFDKPSFAPWFEQFCDGTAVKNLEDYCAVIMKQLDRYGKNGCKLSDHALDNDFTFTVTDFETAARLFDAYLKGEALDACDFVRLRSYVLGFLAREYARRGWVMQLHIGAERWTSSRLRKAAGPAGGYACPGNTVNVRALCDFLDSLDADGLLPKTILYTLNPADNAVLATLTGSYALDGKQKVKFGPAWWYNDHKYGIEENLAALSSYSVLSGAVGMTTDSRTILSFSRHEYFRRILCNYLGGMVNRGELPADYELLGEIVENISYKNAYNWIYNDMNFADAK